MVWLFLSASPVKEGTGRRDQDMADARIISKTQVSHGGKSTKVNKFYATDAATKDDGRPVKGGDVLGRPVGHVVPASERLPIQTEWSGMKDYVNAPPDYGTFHKQYLSYTRHLVAQFGVPVSDLDDVVSDIMIRFLERDSIGVFSRDWESRSATGHSNFRSYYSRFVVTYAQGKNRNVRRHGSRYVLICDASVDDDGRTTWLDEHAPTEAFEERATGDMDFEQLVSELRTKVDPTLSDAVDAVVEIAMGEPTIRVAALARKLNVSQRVAKERLDAVRGALGDLVTSG